MTKKLISLFALIFSFSLIFADEPLPPPETYSTVSSDGRFMLVCDAERNVTICYEKPIAPATELREKWRIPQWHYFSRISDSGEFCVLDDSGGLVAKNCNEKTILFSVFKNGEIFDYITIFKVYGDFRRIREYAAASHYRWGGIKELRDDGIILETADGEKWYDFKTKTLTEK